MQTANKHAVKIIEFTVAPMIQTNGELPFHEWLVEFEETPANLDVFATEVDEALREKNIYYDDLIRGAILQPLKIRPLRRNAFYRLYEIHRQAGRAK